jgi:RimJ/RimL family protein N-acetyltransferase
MDTSPLWDLRIRTPQLELRLPTDEELDELYRVAEAGIHPPEEMPFEVPWTDNLTEESFKDFHRACWDTWSPTAWTLNLVTFLDGAVIGTQGILAKDFADTREVSTGSWLGAAFQRRGFGTEQRAAILEFAFRSLGANVAVSGALTGNVASARVSEKLGYRMTGTNELAPRGEPVTHFNYRIEREEWHCPIPVEIEGLDAARHLFLDRIELEP